MGKNLWLEIARAIKLIIDVIRTFLFKRFGGAIAPAKASRLPRRYLAVMATESTLTGQENERKRKLHGRAFYESIGSPKLVLAPMVEQSEFVCLIASL